MKQHPFEKHPHNAYGFEVGQEVEWFEWIYKYRNSLSEYKNTMKETRFQCDDVLKKYIATNEELLHLNRLLNSFAMSKTFKPFHAKFLKSKKVDRSYLVKFKSLLLKKSDEDVNKDPAYYLSLVNNRL